MDPRRAAVLDQARSWLMTRWHHGAAVRGAGVDCAQLLRACYVDAGLLEAFDAGAYPADWHLHRSEERLLGWIERYCDAVAEPLPGDVAAFRWGRCFSHGAIVVAWPRVIHAFLPERMVVYSDADRGPLADRPVRFYSRIARLDREEATA